MPDSGSARNGGEGQRESRPNRLRLHELKRPWRLFIKERGLHASTVREVVVDAFLQSGAHVDLHEILRLARRKNPRVGFATVYRTMKLLHEAGLADERNFGSGPTLYEATAGKNHHDHLICQRCGTIQEFLSEEIERLQEQAAHERGFRLLRHRHELYGVCAECRALDAPDQ